MKNTFMPKEIEEKTTQETKKIIALPSTITVGDLAKRSGLAVTAIIKILLTNGIIASINDSLDRETIEIIAEELGIQVEPEETAFEEKEIISYGKTSPRPPIVAVMGHVDHGKTTLLDKIRESNIAGRESGGITQHIGAYQIKWMNDKKEEKYITFLDTPGHEAFSALRAHGANITDIGVLVVAADEGVKPQTKEALSHLRAANIPIIVAITKIDKPNAAVDRVKGELAEIDLTPEDWGGKTPVITVSAKSGENIDELLSTIILLAEVNELSAPANGMAGGIVIESHKELGIGPVVTVLVRQGTLRVGDMVVIGNVYGKVRYLENEMGERLKEAGPSKPVKIAGIGGIPHFGAKFKVVDTDREARQIAGQSKTNTPASSTTKREEGEDKKQTKTLAVILKVDVDSSLKAITSALEGIGDEEVSVRIIHSGVGDVTESDIHIAAPLGAKVLAFRAPVTGASKNLARQHGVIIEQYQVIYDLIDDIKKSAEALLEPETEIIINGRLKVLKIFRSTKTHQIIGGRVEEGNIIKDSKLLINRNGEQVGEGTLETLQEGQVVAEEVPSGKEAGMGIVTNNAIEEGDVLVSTTIKQTIKRLA